AAPAGAEDFQHRFLGRKSPGQVLDVAPGVAITVFPLGRGEASLQKTLAVIFQQIGNPPRFDDVNSVAENGHESYLDFASAGALLSLAAGTCRAIVLNSLTT